MAHKPTTRRVVVKTHRPWLAQILTALVLAAFIGQGWGLFNYGRDYGRSELVQLRLDHNRVENTVKNLHEKNAQLSQKLVILERGGQIDRVANNNIQNEIKELQTANADLRERVQFYENILNDAARGLQIKSLAFTSSEQDQYHYKLILAHIQQDREVRGSVNVTLEGTQSGSQKSFALTTLVTDEKLRMKSKIGFKFKYFKHVEGFLKLPEGFTPKLVKIEVVARGRKAAKISKTYEWQEIAS